MMSADRCVAGWRSPHPRAQWLIWNLIFTLILQNQCVHQAHTVRRERVDTCDVCDKFGEKVKAYTIDEKTEKKSEVLLFNIRKDQKSHDIVVSAKTAYLFQSYDFAKTEVTFTLDFSWPKDSSEIEFMSINGYMKLKPRMPVAT